MSEHPAPIRVIRPHEAVWSAAELNPGELDPPGRKSLAFSAADDALRVGLWEREIQQRTFLRPYHEVAYILDGTVEITTEDQRVLTAHAGDFVVTPQGSSGFWRNVAPVRKVFTIFRAA